MVAREVKMAELKKEIEVLKDELTGAKNKAPTNATGQSAVSSC